MQKFVKKPVVVEAEQWLETVEQNERLLAKGVIIDVSGVARDGGCLVTTLEGNVILTIT